MSKKALVLDDMEITRITVSTFLAVCGFEVDCVENGVEGLRALIEKKYDLIFSDIEMPTMGGLEFLRRVKRDPRNKDIPVVMLTSINGDEMIQKAKVLGASSYITKPYNRDKMKLALKTAGF